MKSHYFGTPVLGVVALALVAVAMMVGRDAFAQLQTGKLRGTVSDEQRAVLPGVTVTLTGHAAPQTQVTDNQGRFRFPNLPPGSYHLTAELEGMSGGDHRTVNILVGRTTTIKLTLKPSADDTGQGE